MYGVHSWVERIITTELSAIWMHLNCMVPSAWCWSEFVSWPLTPSVDTCCRTWRCPSHTGSPRSDNNRWLPVLHWRPNRSSPYIPGCPHTYRNMSQAWAGVPAGDRTARIQPSRRRRNIHTRPWRSRPDRRTDACILQGCTIGSRKAGSDVHLSPRERRSPRRSRTFEPEMPTTDTDRRSAATTIDTYLFKLDL